MKPHLLEPQQGLPLGEAALLFPHTRWSWSACFLPHLVFPPFSVIVYMPGRHARTPVKASAVCGAQNLICRAPNFHSGTESSITGRAFCRLERLSHIYRTMPKSSSWEYNTIFPAFPYHHLYILGISRFHRGDARRYTYHYYILVSFI